MMKTVLKMMTAMAMMTLLKMTVLRNWVIQLSTDSAVSIVTVMATVISTIYSHSIAVIGLTMMAMVSAIIAMPSPMMLMKPQTATSMVLVTIVTHSPMTKMRLKIAMAMV